MADDEKVGEEGTSRGADWEVVSLTASTYAAAPSPLEVDPAGESEVMESVSNPESSAAGLFMSGHFVFPPSEHENLPIQLNTNEISGGPEEHNGNPGMVDADDGIYHLQTESKDDLHGVEFFDEGKRVSVHEMGLEEAKGPQKSTLVGMEQSVLADPDSIASHSGTHRSNIKFKTNESFDVNTDSSREHKIDDEDESSGPELPSQAWWKRHVASVYHQAKEANTFWSVIVAAAVVGIIVIGRRWQQDKWKLAITDEKMSRMLKPVGRFKNVLLGGHQPSKGIH
ncbi:ATG8-interacting protein 1-like isoform X1 [Zingiber officinale]|uniref:ATG8-interacting protein 1-like isoform X1 n=1 Tax=Zingiber officinale TaxID=94328 RepID=UPI001C4C758D|nr:ATG8-interacting protein 1-like isoform X1 [Zingiber officinale]